MASRISLIESSLELGKYETELNKQNALSRNLSIMGVPATENEDLSRTPMKIFSLIGCDLNVADIFGCYLIKNGNQYTNIFIVKINDVGIKQQILKAKINKEVRLRDVVNMNSNDNPLVFLNNHVTFKHD